MMTKDEIEKDIIWKKLHGDFSEKRLRNQAQFTATGNDSTYQIDHPDCNYTMYVYIDSVLVLFYEYTIHEVNHYITVILDHPPPANSIIQFNIIY